MTEKRLFLLDAYALIFRAYYALIKVPRLTADGFNTSAIFGFVNTLEEILRKENPSHIAVCFDPQGPTFRSEAFEEYKGERASTPEDIKLSIPIIKEIIRAYNIPILEVEGFEADDVIGTMARRAEKEGFTTYMMTPDKDFGQLVSPTVLQYKPSYRGQDFELRGEEEVCARYGIRRTEQVIDILALMGDKIDNIPGCPGVGEKTATKLIEDFGSVENLLENTDQLKGAMRRKVEENAEQIRFSKYLATIRTDVPVEERPDDLIRQKPDRDKLFAIFRNFEFKSLAERVERRLDAEEGKTAPTSRTAPSGTARQLSLFDSEEEDTSSAPAQAFDAGALTTTIVSSSVTLAEMQTQLMGVDSVGLFMVTEGENDVEAKWLGTALADGRGHAWYIPSSFEEGRMAMLDLMARTDVLKVMVESKRAWVIAARHRTDNAVPLVAWFDDELAHYILQPDMRHDLELLAGTYLSLTLPARPVPPARGRKAGSLADVETSAMAAWAAPMADVILSLKEPLEREVEEEDMHSLLFDLELPLVPVLAGMELSGVRLDVEALNAAAAVMEARLADMEREIYDLAGVEFNIGSPARVGEILFDRLALDPKAKKTKTGQYSTSESVLEGVAHKHPIVGRILEYRQVKKLLNTYLTALPTNINPRTGKVHTNYNQTVTATGRISSSNPNLQNIPVRDEVGREIRRAFIADEGHLFLSADYSQIELRLVADLASEETMLDAFAHDKDIHAITAAKIYHHDSPEDVSAEERRHAKTANFGILYGISAFGLASRLGIPRGEAKELIDNYFLRFPDIRQYMSRAVEEAREHGYVSTAIGRKRRLPDINSRNPVVRGYAERNAINAPIQGAAADIIKRAMVDIDAEISRRGLKSRMIMQVHDELNFDVVPEELPQMQQLVVSLMEHAYHGRVRLTASCGVGTNWLDAH